MGMEPHANVAGSMREAQIGWAEFSHVRQWVQVQFGRCGHDASPRRSCIEEARVFRKEWGCDFAASRLGVLRRGGLDSDSIA